MKKILNTLVAGLILGCSTTFLENAEDGIPYASYWVPIQIKNWKNKKDGRKVVAFYFDKNKDKEADIVTAYLICEGDLNTPPFAVGSKSEGKLYLDNAPADGAVDEIKEIQNIAEIDFYNYAPNCNYSLESLTNDIKKL
ncbi:MAG TPA: hypothetical protein VJH65_03785 [Candidatus Nanoarchaeia archaeon]|nr:hypothetical protein [Candidatus Nanoarchaeia archaeon]